MIKSPKKAENDKEAKNVCKYVVICYDRTTRYAVELVVVEAAFIALLFIFLSSDFRSVIADRFYLEVKSATFFGNVVCITQLQVTVLSAALLRPVKKLLHARCRPICKNRRRTWKGKVLNTSAELLAEKERQTGLPDYSAVISQSRSSGGTDRAPVTPVNTRKSSTVKICKTPIDDTAPTPCLAYADLAKSLGAWQSVRSKCAFCACYACCLCSGKEYALAEEDAERRRSAMRDFDRRVKSDCKLMRIMYNKI